MTGIRVSELAYITVETAWEGRAEVKLKGKIGVILLPGMLCRKLLKYAKRQGGISVETTRICLLMARKEHARQFELTGLIIHTESIFCHRLEAAFWRKSKFVSADNEMF